MHDLMANIWENAISSWQEIWIQVVVILLQLYETKLDIYNICFATFVNLTQKKL